jgi:hypothetical protein
VKERDEHGRREATRAFRTKKPEKTACTVSADDSVIVVLEDS